MKKRAAVPPMYFDGSLFWYTDWFDPNADLCCVCREPIPEEDVPLILFKKVVSKEDGRQTWQTRIHFHPCAERLIKQGVIAMKWDA